MRQLKRKHQQVILFSLFFFFFLVIFSSLVYFLFDFILQSQLKRDLAKEVSEVVISHINIENNQLRFLKSKNGETLRQTLFNEGVSALFYDASTSSLIRKYGIFELQNKNEGSDLAVIQNELPISFSKNKAKEIIFFWNDQKIISVLAPLKKDSKPYGAMLLAKPASSTKEVTDVMLLVLISMGVIGLAGSFILGNIITNKTLFPLRSMIKIIDEINLDKLNKFVYVEGHEKDELVVLTNKFNDMLLRLKEMSEKQKEFIDNASHELKTPITKAVSTLDLLLSQKTLSREELIDVKSDLFELNDLVEELLALSKARADIMPKTGNTYLRALVDKIQEKYQEEIMSKNLSVEIGIDHNFTMPLPKKYLEIILSNLFSNAIKFSPDHGLVKLKSKEALGFKFFEITDSGEGLSENEKGKIFDRFYRAPDTYQKTKGHGIGLSIVKQLCDLYQIEISVEKNMPTGTRFILRCPS